jgi:hypothetical protein
VKFRQKLDPIRLSSRRPRCGGITSLLPQNEMKGNGDETGINRRDEVRSPSIRAERFVAHA